MARAIELDPGFANAYALRARALFFRLWILYDLTDEQWRMIGRDIDSAERLAGDTEAVLAAQAYFEYFGQMDYPRALETTRAALIDNRTTWCFLSSKDCCCAGRGDGTRRLLCFRNSLTANH